MPSFRKAVCFAIASTLGMLVASFPSRGQAEPWPATAWVGYCSPYSLGDCVLEPTAIGPDLHQLREASERFQSMGFLAPALEIEPGSPPAYAVYFAKDGSARMGSENIMGTYFPHVREIELRYPHAPSHTATHELFHAIQFAYPGTLDLYALSLEAHWVVEGTADAAALVISGNTATRKGGPWLDVPLHDPDAQGRGFYGDYISYPFWLYLAEAYGGGLPDGFAVLHGFFLDLDKQKDRVSSVAKVDGALRGIDPEGLYNIYPGYIASYGQDPEQYKNVFRIQARPPGELTYNTQVAGTVEAVSAQAFLVEVVGIGEQAGSGASEVEIRLKAQDPDALHLVVDGARYDGPGAERNIHTAEITGQTGQNALTREEFFVRVVNVARDAAAYRPQAFELIVTVYHEYIEVHGMALAGGEGGPSNEAIDSPIALPVRVRTRYWGPWGPQTAGSPCTLTLGVDGANGPQGGLTLLTNAILAPGEYPIAPLPPDHMRTPLPEEQLREYPGMVTASFMLLHEQQEGEALWTPYVGYGGVLTIDRITPRWVAGSARITLEIDQYMGADDFSGAYEGAPRSGPRYVELAFEFSLPNRRYGRTLDFVASCIEG